MAVKKAFKDLTPDQKARVKAIMEEQDEEDIDLEDPDETTVEKKTENGRRIIVIEGPEVDLILRQLGISEDEVEETEDEKEEKDDDDDDENENDEVVEPPKKKRGKAADVDAEREEPKPAPRSRYFGGGK